VGEPIQLINLPKLPERIDINYAKFSKIVDVKQLKKSMWKEISNKKKQQNTSLQNIIDAMPKYLDDEAINSASVPIYFICLLHLANEYSLDIYEKNGKVIIGSE